MDDHRDYARGIKISGALSPGERFSKIEDVLTDMVTAVNKLTVQLATSEVSHARTVLDTDRRYTDVQTDLRNLRSLLEALTARIEQSERKKAMIMGLVLGSGSLGGGAGAILAKVWGM